MAATKIKCLCGAHHKSQRTFDACPTNRTRGKGVGTTPNGRYGKPTLPDDPGVTIARGGWVEETAQVSSTSVGRKARITDEAAVEGSTLDGNVTVSGGHHVRLVTDSSVHGWITGGTQTSNVSVSGEVYIGGEYSDEISIDNSVLEGNVVVEGSDITVGGSTLTKSRYSARVHLEGDRIAVYDSELNGDIHVSDDSLIRSSKITPLAGTKLSLDAGTHIIDGKVENAWQVRTFTYGESLDDPRYATVTVYPHKDGRTVAVFHRNTDGVQLFDANDIAKIQSANQHAGTANRNVVFDGYSDEQMGEVTRLLGTGQVE